MVLHEQLFNCFVRISLANVDVDAQIALILDVSLKICHLVVIIDPVDDEVGEHRVLSFCFEDLTEQGEGFLAEVVAEELEGHEGGVLGQCLCEQRQTHVIDLVVCEVQVDERLIDGESLSNGLSTVVTAAVVSQM